MSRGLAVTVLDRHGDQLLGLVDCVTRFIRSAQPAVMAALKASPLPWVFSFG